MVYSTWLFVLRLALCYFFLWFSVLLELLLHRIGKGQLSAFRTFVRFAPVWFCLLYLALGAERGLG